MVCIGCLSLLLIPFQLARYVRQMRTGNLDEKEVFNFRALGLRQPQSIKKRNYVFAFLVACLIPAASVYIHSFSFYVLWGGGHLYQVVTPFDSPETCFTCLCFGAISFPVLIPFLRFRLLRWCVVLTLCAFWILSGFLQVAKMK